MSNDTIAAHLEENPEMAGVLFRIALRQFRTRATVTRNAAYAGP